MLVSLLAAAVAATDPPIITNPDWLTRPRADDVSQYYPAHAVNSHITGEAVIHCNVNLHGRLEACEVTSETPPGEGFGAAALLLAPSFSMRPATGPNGPVVAEINLPIVFTLPHFSPAAPPTDNPYGGGTRLAPIRQDLSYANVGQTLIVHPVWTTAPSFAEVGEVYPRDAGGGAGHVVLQCRVTSDGALKSCSTLTEAPPGKGFAKAADALVGRFRVSADSLSARGSEPSYVDVPFQLVDPGSDEFKQHRIGAPTWRLALDPTKVAQVYPEAAAAKGITTGRGVAKCSVAADGGLTACEEMPGDPDGLGFSHSAVVIAGSMAMNPWTDEGAPVDGSTIVLPIRFNLAVGTSDATTRPPK